MVKWSVTEVSQASGLSEGAISGYFSNRGVSTKKGLNLFQILECLNAPRRDHGINNTEKVKKLVRILQVAGVKTPYTYQEEE